MKLRQLDENMISYEEDEHKNILIAANSQDKLELEIKGEKYLIFHGDLHLKPYKNYQRHIDQYFVKGRILLADSLICSIQLRTI